jgi:hypothetical protein
MNPINGAAKLLNHPVRLIVTGRSTVGKTTLCVDVICEKIIKNVKRVFAVCPTFWEQAALSRLHQIPNCFNNKNVFTEVNDEVFEKIYEELSKNNIPTLLFVDDAAADKATNSGNKGAFSKLCLAAPHLNLTIVGCFQRLTACSPAFRDNTEALVSFIASKQQDADTVVKEFNPFPNDRTKDKYVRAALQLGWDTDRFTFIYREPFVGKVHFYSGFKKKIQFNQVVNVKNEEGDVSIPKPVRPDKK